MKSPSLFVDCFNHLSSAWRVWSVKVVQKTMIFITHDFLEAIKTGDRIAIMKDGEFVQVTATFRFILRPISLTVKMWLKQLDAFFLGFSWPVIVFGVLLLVGKIGGLRLGLFAAGCLMLIGSLGLWDTSIKTLTIMALSVVFTLIVGIPLGVWAARSDRFEAVLRPVHRDGLEVMSKLPRTLVVV